MKRFLPLLSIITALLCSCQKEPEVIPVTGITVNPTEITLVEGETTTVSVTVTPASATDKSVLWSSSAPSVASVADGTVTALKEGNAEISATSGDGRLKAVCRVKVEAPAPVILVSRKEFTLPSSGGEISVEVQSNINVTVEMPADAPWVREISTKALSTHTFSFAVEPNADYDGRSAHIVFTDADSGISESISIVQAQRNAIVVSGSQVFIPDEGGSFEIQLSSNVEYDVSIDGDWVRLEPGTKGLVQSSHAFVADPLPEGAFVRELSIHFTERGGSLSSTMTVLQQDSSPIIQFRDAAVKEICISKWDRNSDKELSMREAAAVSNLGYSFYNNPSIASFDELVYFTKVKSLPNSCFYNCSNLSSVVLPEGLESIGEFSFYNCSGLGGTLGLPEMLIEIGRYAFYNCTGLTGDLDIPDGVTVIPERCFSGCKGLNGTLILPKGLTEIGSYAFSYCPNLGGTLNLPEKLTEIGPYAFYRCSGFTGDLNIPDGVTVIPERCFSDCTGLNGALHLPNGLTGIDRYAFYKCSGFTGDLFIPDGVTAISEWCFYSCTGFKGTLHLPEKLTEIGPYAFHMCSGFTGDLYIPDGVTVIPESCFSDCAGFNGKLHLPDNLSGLGNSSFSNCSGLTGDLDIPDGVTVIPGWCFANCTGLDGTLHLPGGLTELSDHAFYRCSSMTGIVIDAVSPPAYGNSALNSVKCLIYVPSGTAGQYQVSSGWETLRRLITEEGHKPVDFFYASTDYSRDGEVLCLQKATKGKGIDIVFMGDGFLDRDMEPGGKYETVMRQWMEQFFVYEPYRSYRDWFTVYTVKVVSKHDEFKCPDAERRLTRDGEEGVFGNTISTLTAVCEEYYKFIPDHDSHPSRIAVFMNTDSSVGRSYCSFSSGGFCKAWIFDSPDRRPTTLNHELGGHGFGLLADEYIEFNSAYPDPQSLEPSFKNGLYLNVDWKNDPASVNWSRLLNDPRYANEGLGIFEGAITYAYGVYRPTDNSIMASDFAKGAVFNAPSRESIYKQIMRFGMGKGWAYDYEAFVAADEAGRRQAAEAYAGNPAKRSAGRYVERDGDFPPGLPPILLDGPVKEVRIREDGRITVIR